jgi:hypothetical protein
MDTPGPADVARYRNDPSDLDARDRAAEAVRQHGTLEVDGKVYRYDPATGDVVEVEAPKAEPTSPSPAPEPEPKAAPKPARKPADA